jgi:coenzyme Q-binding protein COQ10
MSCKFHDKKTLPHSAEKLYQVVADIESYPSFLPGCVDAKVLEKGDGYVRASLTIGYGPFRESYISRVLLTPFNRIEVVYESGPFSYLKNHWTFHEASKTETEVEFFIDFKLRSFILQKAIESVFLKNVQHLMDAFERRVLGAS